LGNIGIDIGGVKHMVEAVRIDHIVMVDEENKYAAISTQLEKQKKIQL
jgi:hypothetical protein